MKILIFATDLLPLPGVPTSGTALRTFGIAEGLRAHGHDVVVSVPETAILGFERANHNRSLDPKLASELQLAKRFAFNSSNQGRIIEQFGNVDAIICGHWPAMSLRVKPSQCLIVDLAGPHLLERHYQRSPDQIAAILGKTGIVGTADYCIVSGPSQLYYFLSFLARAGVRHWDSRILTVTMPLSPKLPERIDQGEPFPRFIFGGVFLPWQDPSHGLEQLVATLREKNAGSLTLIGGKHPHYDVREGRYTQLFKRLAENSFVTTKPMLPFEQFVAELADADVALDLMSWNLERQLAVTIRSTTYLWAGLPVIYNNYADLGRLIEQYDAGWTVPPEDSAALRAVLNEIFSTPELVAEKAKNARRLAREVFAWDRAVLPIVEALNAGAPPRDHEIDIIIDSPDVADLFISGSETIEQRFICRMDGFEQLDCRVATHGRRLQEPVILRLYEDGAPPLLVAERIVEPERIENNGWLSLPCSRVANSAGKLFCFEISAPTTRPENSLSPWAAKASPYPLQGVIYRGHKRPHLALSIRTVCSPDLEPHFTTPHVFVNRERERSGLSHAISAESRLIGGG